MANIKIDSTSNSIQVDFGVYGITIDEYKGVWQKKNISIILKLNHIEVNAKHEKTWCVSHDENTIDCETFQIDLVNTVAPSSLLDLFTKLQDLIA